MQFTKAGNLLVGALAAATFLPAATEAKTCLMLYQMADNNLEYYIRQDYEELSESPVINSPDLRTWIYYDGTYIMMANNFILCGSCRLLHPPCRSVSDVDQPHR